jgi:glycosyltransferase involved in cell wall biosynthesis
MKIFMEGALKKNKKKRICFVCYRRFPDTNYEHYSKFTCKNGFDVSIISYLDSGQKKYELRDSRKVYRVNLPHKPEKRISRVVFTCKVINFLKTKKFDIIHIHASCRYFVLLKFFLPKNIKFIIHSTSYPIAKKKIKVIKKFILFSVQAIFLNKIIIQSEELKKKYLGIKSLKKTCVVPIGFNKKIMYPLKKNIKYRLRKILNIAENYSVLIYSGSMDKIRELDKLIFALAILKTFNCDFKMLLVGNGDNLNNIKRLVKKLDLDKSLIFTGRVKHNRMMYYYGLSDIGISFIPINDNFNFNPPLKTFEYLSCGLPTIATSTESNTKIITDGFNGILTSDDPVEISKKIFELTNNKTKQADLTKNAIKSIKAYDFETITKEYLIPIYNNM